MASTYLSKSQSSSNQQIFTISCWFKIGNPVSGYNNYLNNFYSDSNNRVGIIFVDNQDFYFYGLNSGVTNVDLETSQKFRDINGWYHVVVKVDTTQATASDRVKIYINGAQVTSFSAETYPTQNLNFPTNSTHYIGTYDASTFFWTGLITHYHYTDGYAYDASTFGEYDAQNVWKPKTAPSVTYGTNGCFLKFANAGSLGTDSSGNGNDFTVSGTGTQTLDTPSNVFATLNSEYSNVSGLTFSNGNNTITNSTSWLSSISTLGMQKGKWYCEVKAVTGTNHSLGVIEYSGSSSDSYYNGANIVNQGLIGGYGKNWGWYGLYGSFRYGANVELTTGNTYTAGDILQIALDYDNGKIWFGKNGTWENSGDPSNGTNPIFSGITFTDATFFAFGPESASQSVNFGNGYFGTTAVSTPNADGAGYGKFEYSVPTGYYALCTKNIETYG